MIIPEVFKKGKSEIEDVMMSFLEDLKATNCIDVWYIYCKNFGQMRLLNSCSNRKAWA